MNPFGAFIVTQCFFPLHPNFPGHHLFFPPICMALILIFMNSREHVSSSLSGPFEDFLSLLEVEGNDLLLPAPCAGVEVREGNSGHKKNLSWKNLLLTFSKMSLCLTISSISC